MYSSVAWIVVEGVQGLVLDTYVLKAATRRSSSVDEELVPRIRVKASLQLGIES